jgi:hypothetical protein
MLNNQRLLNLMFIGLLLLGTAPTVAQPTTNRSARTDRTLTEVDFKPPPEDQKPERTEGAGSRHGGRCPQDATVPTGEPPTLMALVPTTNTGLTLAERPTFWVYLSKTSAKKMVLSIREEGTTHHSQTFVPLTGGAGLISLQPNPDSPPLEVGKTYQWAVVLVCGERPSPNDPAIASWVRRVALSQPQPQGTALEQAAWYGERGIWYDALESLARARRAQPDNNELLRIWTEFLESEGLGEIAAQPLRF